MGSNLDLQAREIPENNTEDTIYREYVDASARCQMFRMNIAGTPNMLLEFDIEILAERTDRISAPEAICYNESIAVVSQRHSFACIAT